MWRALSLRALMMLAIALSMLGGGCSLVDYSYLPRANDINENTRNARETTILTNLVRASRSEPLNFVALSKYTGTGTLGATDTLLRNDVRPFLHPNPTFLTMGANTVGVNASAQNSFDVGTLENRDFYGGFLAPLDLQSLNLLLNAGLDREIVFNSVMRSFRVTSSSGVPYLFENNPDDDSYLGEPRSLVCLDLYPRGANNEAAFEPVFRSEIWQKPHEKDCRYQKFLYFLRLAVRYGVTVEALPLAPSQNQKSATGGGGGGGGGSQNAPVADYYVCYDPAIAKENGLKQKWNGEGACGNAATQKPSKTQEFKFKFQLPYGILQVLPVVRSPYDVFQFYGFLLKKHLTDRVRLSLANSRERGPRERVLLTIHEGEFVDCFALAFYGAASYCVPNEGTKNTKQIFVMLNTLVAMSINRSALPVSPTFVLSP